jgi:hypothetical protein
MATTPRTPARAGKAQAITLNSKNEEVRKAFTALVATGQPFVFAVFPSQNEDYQMLCIAQELVVPGTEVTAVQKTFLGWDERDPRLVRCLQAVKTELADEFAVGTVLDGFTIAVTRLDFPAYEGQAEVINPETNAPVLKNGKLQYEHRELVEAAE